MSFPDISPRFKHLRLPTKDVRLLEILVLALVGAVEHLLSRAEQDAETDNYRELIFAAKKEVGL